MEADNDIIGIINECFDKTVSDNQQEIQNQVNSWMNDFQEKNNNIIEKFDVKINNIKDNDYSSLHQLLDIYLEYNISRENCINLKFNLYFRENRTAEALELLERYKDDVGDRYHALRAKIYIEEKKYKEGLDYIEDWLKKISYESPEYAKMLGYKLVCLYYLGNYNDVISLYEKEVDESGDVRLQFLYRHLHLLSCIMVEDNEKRDQSLSDIKSLTDDTERKFFCRDYWFYDAYDKETKTLDWNKINESLKNINIYEFLYYMIRYSYSLKYTPDDLIKQHVLPNLSDQDLYFKNLMASVPEKSRLKYNKIWFWTQIILMMLIVKDEDKINRFSHYTSKETALNLINGEYHIAKMSLSNANDKIEGAVLPIIFQKNEINFNIDYKDDDNRIAIQTSFSRKENDLTMFRLYGKENGEEATGVSLVFNKTFFKTNLAAIEGNIFGASHSETVDKREPLIWILYYDKSKNRLFYFPDEDELDAYIIDLNIDLNKNDKKKDDWNEYKDNEKKEQTQNRLRYSFKKLFDAINELKTDEEKKIAMKILYQLRYCIKSSDFADEKECRILEVCNPFDDDIEEDSNKVLYKNYLQINNNKNFLEKIIVGPKVSKPTVIKEYVQRNMQKTKIEVTVSNAPLD